MKRLNEIARKTGLSEKETRQFTKIGFWSFIAFVFMGIFGCAKNGSNKKPVELSPSENNVNLPSMEEIAKEIEIERSTSPIHEKAEERSEDNCGPYPGYPCGTKYYTVSVRDFGIRA